MGGIKLTWTDENLAEEGHRVYRSTTPMDPDNLPTEIATLGPDVTRYDDGDVVEGETYYYRVASFTAGDTVQAVSEELEILAEPLPFTPGELFSSGELGAWFDISDMSTLFQDVAGTTPVTSDGDPVALILDKSGNNNHAEQVSNSRRPIFRISGGLSWLESTTDQRIGATGLYIPQPVSFALSFKQDTIYTDNQIIDRDDGGESQWRAFFSVRNSKFQLYADTFLNSGIDADLNKHSAICTVDGANSLIRIDSTSVTGNAGARKMSGFWMFDSDTGESSGDTMDGRMYGGVIIGRTLTPAERSDLISYYNSKAGI